MGQCYPVGLRFSPIKLTTDSKLNSWPMLNNYIQSIFLDISVTLHHIHLFHWSQYNYSEEW